MKQHGAVKVRRGGRKGYYANLITIPAEVVAEMGLKVGDYLQIESDRDIIVLRKLK